ncbi:MAG: hypothetical protein KF744_04270 [Taibaiella sp.]|nr:hypothetical protein [Taibaiella sp.]
MSRLISFCMALLLAIVCTAQEGNWVVTRSSILHSTGSSSSPAVANVGVGTRLQLLSSAMSNNYYHVQVTETGATGWIYKNRIAQAETGLDSVSVRVIDVDNGLCVIIRLPENKYVIYDAGGLNNADGSETWEQMKAFLPEGATVEFMVLSHMDGDHIVAASQAIRGYDIKQVIWGGYDRKIDGSSATETRAFKKLKEALDDKSGVTESINLNERDSMITPWNDMQISGVHFRFLCGFGKPPAQWHLTDPAERLNGVSIVMKMEYNGNSVLFTGDALGRRKDNPETTCIATEAFLLDNVGDDLKSTVMFSPHHGAENGSSRPFMDKVRPEYIIIPAGHVANFLHPRKTTCERYLDYVAADHIFRTDRGDDQGPKEWDYQRIAGCRDRAGDDDIQVDLRSDKKLHIYYLNQANTCNDD